MHRWQNGGVKLIPFTLEVPKGIRFYSAHFKIDALRWFATRPSDEYSILVDNDVVAIAPLPGRFLEAAGAGMPVNYILPHEMPPGGGAQVHGICPEVDEASFAWAGGELIGGTAGFYKRLVEKIDCVLPAYFRALGQKQLFHTGDEMPVSIAWHLLGQEGVRPVEAYSAGLLYRYWGNAETRPLRHYGVSLMHLPYDKLFLAKVDANRLRTPSDIVRLYRRQRVRNTLVRWLKRLLNPKRK